MMLIHSDEPFHTFPSLSELAGSTSPALDRLRNIIVRCSETISDSEILEAIPVRKNFPPVCVLIGLIGDSCVLDWR